MSEPSEALTIRRFGYFALQLDLPLKRKTPASAAQAPDGGED